MTILGVSATRQLGDGYPGSLQDDPIGRVMSPFLITGMHRSGTSLTARIANLLGLYLGKPEHLLPPAPDNPKGYWEHEGLMRVSVRVLEALGRTSARPRCPLPDRWEERPELRVLEARARQIVGQEFENHKVWGWKDPRLCLTIPFWARVKFPRGVVLVLRHPVNVAQSLVARGGFSEESALELWCAYHFEFLRALRRLKRVPLHVVVLERLHQFPKREITGLAMFLKLDPEDRKLTEACAAIDQKLWHHRRLHSFPSLALRVARTALASYRLLPLVVKLGVFGRTGLLPCLLVWLRRSLPSESPPERKQ